MPDEPGTPAAAATEPPRPAGADLARQMLNLARAEARKRGTTPTKRTPARRSRRATGPGRDPQKVGSVIDQLVDAFGWRRPSAGAEVIIRWPELAGDAARLASPERYDAETRTLYLRPVSPAAATQLRLTARQVAAAVNAATADGTVTGVRVLPPGHTTPTPDREDAVPARPAAAPGTPDGPTLRTRHDASTGLMAAHDLLATLKAGLEDTRTPATARPYVPTLREPEEQFTDAVAIREDLAARAAAAEDVRARAIARKRLEQSGQAPAVPRVFGRTA